MKDLIIILSVLILTSCVTQSVLTTQETATIPAGSKFIDCNTNSPPDSLYKTLYKDLLKIGCKITSENEEMHYLVAEKYLEQGTNGRYTMFIDNRVLTISCEWQPSSEVQTGVSAGMGVGFDVGYSQAIWGETGRPAVAFSHGVKFAQKYGDLKYRKE